MFTLISNILLEGISFLKDKSKNKFEKENKINEIILEISKLGFKNANAQIETNTAEASNTNRKWITWREACGWTCVIGLMWDCFSPGLFTLFNGLYHIFTKTTLQPFSIPNYDTSTLITILIGMLGLGAYNTVEKIHSNKWEAKTKKYNNTSGK